MNPIQNIVLDTAKAKIGSTVSGYIHPKLAEKVGFGVGAMILLVGYSKYAKAARLKRIEQKLDKVAK